MIVVNPRRGAFTAVELLVVIAVVGVLAALTLVGVQAGRESARRAACSNNLHQFGVALNGYVTAKGQFPKDGYLAGYSFIVELLPHLERSDLFKSINFQTNAYDYENRLDSGQATPTVATFLCPADWRPARGRFGWTSYAGNRGTGVQTHGYNGAFVMQHQDSGMGIFVDGTSQTAAMCEWNLGPEDLGARDRLRTVFATPKPLLEKDQLDEFRAYCHGLDSAVAKPSVRVKGFDWIIAEFGNSFYNHVLTPNDMSCLNKTAVQQGAWTAGSQHLGGGANVLFVDGHTQWVAQRIAPVIWQALGSRAGGEPIPSGNY